MLMAIRHIIKFFLYLLSGWWVFPSRKIAGKSLLLIRLDLIGDYLLFRNFLPSLKQSKKYSGYHLTLLGNARWSELAESLDKEYVDRFIWLDVETFNNNCRYRIRMMREISGQGFGSVVSPIFSRDYYTADWIAGQLYAHEKIGNSGDLSNIPAWQKRISDRYFTRLIDVGNEAVFEFYKNKRFFEALTGTQSETEKPVLKPLMPAVNNNLPPKYAVLFLGASKKYKKWPVSEFAKVAVHIINKYNMPVIICGGKGDVQDARAFEQACDRPYVNLVGKTSLTELMNVIGGAQVLVSNDTSAPHFAVALNVPCVVLYNGIHQGRFAPYPTEMHAKYMLVSPDLNKDNAAITRGISKKKKQEPDYVMSKINVEDVLAAVDSLMKADA